MRRLAALLACIALTACAPQEKLAPMPTPRIYASLAEAEAAVPTNLFSVQVRGTGSMEEFGRWRGYDVIVGVVGYDFTPWEDLRLGDLVLRYDAGKMVMHRIIAHFPGGFVLRGTANDGIDKFANNTANLLTRENYAGHVKWIGVIE